MPTGPRKVSEMCKTNPREVGLTRNGLVASFHPGPPWRPFAATSFHHPTFSYLRVLGKHLWGEPWIPAASPPNTSLFFPLQVLPPPEAQPEPSSPGNPPQPLPTLTLLPAVGGHCSLTAGATLPAPLGSPAPSSLMASHPFPRSPSQVWAQGVNISRELGRVCMQARER